MSNQQIQLQEPVVIVEDDAPLRALIAETVSSMGYRVMTAGTSEEGLELIKAHSPFLIFSDFKMPGMTGIELCQKVREFNANCPFVLVTAYAEKEVAIEGMKNGVSDFIEKPFKIDQLSEMVVRFADKRIKALEQERQENDEIIGYFVEEVADLMVDVDKLILRLEDIPVDPAIVDALFRKFHTVKGGAGAIPIASVLARLGHDFESCLVGIKNGEITPTGAMINLFLEAYDYCLRLLNVVKTREQPTATLVAQVDQCIDSLKDVHSKKDAVGKAASVPAAEAKKPSTAPAVASGAAEPEEEEAVWVTNEKLDAMMKVSGELIFFKNNFQMLSRDPELYSNPQRMERKLADLAQALGKLTDQLQGEIMDVRKIKLDRSFGKLPRMVRQVSQELGKKVVLEQRGWDLGVDKSIAKALAASLTHIVRNSVDHGIEAEELRLSRGKPATGTVVVSAAEEKGVIRVSVADDGAGIHRDKIAAKAVKKGMITEDDAKKMTDEQVFDILFAPGFSTAEKVSSISGRGVGMDVVKSQVHAIGGKVRIESQPDKGTTISIEIPTPKTVMVEQTVLIRSDEVMLAVPLSSISTIVSTDQLPKVSIEKMATCQVNGKTVRIGTFQQLLNLQSDLSSVDPNKKVVIVMEHRGEQLAMLADAIHQQLEAVVRPFDGIVQSLPGFKGTTVLGDDTIAYVMLPEEFVSIGLGLGASAA